MRHNWRRGLGIALLTTVMVAASCTSDTDDGGGDGTTDESARYSAEIVRTSHGIPHITADDYGSLGFGQGYAFAEDHLCTLADQIVRANSERARHHGAGEEDEYLNEDLAYLTIGIRRIAEESWDEIDRDAQELIEGYVAGYNDYLDETGADAVPGFCQGEPWVVPIDAMDLWTYIRLLMIRASGGAIAEFVATAAPPGDEAETPDAGTGDETALGEVAPAPLASNAWAVGADRTEDGTAMLLGNPHFPWEGEARFWESHLTVPGQLDIYGASLLGAPLIQIGFNEHVAWSHTVSAGKRFTAYSLDLVEGDPTSYLYDGEPRAMTSEDVTVDVLGDDGEITEVTRTMWSSHYGPIIDFPGVGWSDTMTLTYRDGNIDNSEAIGQWKAMALSESMDDLQAAHETHQGIPWVNTIAASSDGRAWYADTAATPKLGDEAIAGWEAAVEGGGIASVAFDNGVVLLDGSDSVNEWEEVDGARDPGLVPYAEMPRVERSDYVFNANDSYWVPNGEEFLTGDYSPLHGSQLTPVSPRTRENARVLGDNSDTGVAGEGGLFDLEEFRTAVLANRSFTATELRSAVVERCDGADAVEMPALMDTSDEEAEPTELVPAGPVDVSAVCAALADWDEHFDLDSVGAVVWREFINQYGSSDFRDAGPLWSVPFDPEEPIATPSGLAAPPADAPDPVLEHLAVAAQVLTAAGIEPDATLGEVQYAANRDDRIPIHGGGGKEGITNIVSFSGNTGSTEEVDTPDTIGDSDLTADGYPIDYGTSFVYTLEFTADGPQGFAFLTYGESGDRDSEFHSDQTELFSRKEWRPIRFTADDVAEDEIRSYRVTG